MKVIDTFFAEDLLVTCIEGGSNYWIDSIGWSDPDRAIKKSGWTLDNIRLWREGVITLMIWCEGKVYLLDVKKMIRYAYTHWSEVEVWDLDAWDWDAVEADVILQNALFGEVVYG